MHRQGALPELLVPASGPETLKVAVHYGADAVYIGGEAFSLRARAQNFTAKELRQAVSWAHGRGVKVYVTVNILAHNSDLEEADAYLKELADIGPDALLVADPGIFALARRICPGIPLHISTQANNVNYETFRFWHGLGAERVVCGRELSLSEISRIREQIPDSLEVEAFVHGAMCISYSGRCLVSNFLTGRDANRGACTHPCRWQYRLHHSFWIEEETRPGERMEICENDRGTFLFNSKDLCMVEHIPDMIDAGIDSLKIEGRMKNALYVATVARTYRRALDDLARGRGVYDANMDWYREQIRDCTFRPFTTGFFYGKPGADAQIYDSNTYEKTSTYLGCVQAVRQDGGRSWIELEQKNKFSVGETVELMGQDGTDTRFVITRILDEDGKSVQSAPHPKQRLLIETDAPARQFDILRRPERLRQQDSPAV